MAKKECTNPACHSKGLKVDTEKNDCLFCHKPLKAEGMTGLFGEAGGLGSLFGDIFKKP